MEKHDYFLIIQKIAEAYYFFDSSFSMEEHAEAIASLPAPDVMAIYADLKKDRNLFPELKSMGF